MLFSKDDWAFIFLGYLLAHFCFTVVILPDYYSFPAGIRFILEKDLPFLVFIGLFYQTEIRRFFKIELVRRLSFFALSMFGFMLALLVASFFAGLSFEGVLGLSWSYQAVFEWTVAITLFFFLFNRITSKTEASMLAVLLAKVAGLIYEIPIYPQMNPHVGIWAHTSYPFFIASGWILLGLLFLYLRKRFVLTNRKLFGWACLGLLAFSVIYGSNLIAFSSWIPRAPTIAVLSLGILLLRRRPFRFL